MKTQLLLLLLLSLLQKDVSGDDTDIFCELVSINSITSWCVCEDACNDGCSGITCINNKIKEIDVSSRWLTSIPDSIGNLTNLKLF